MGLTLAAGGVGLVLRSVGYSLVVFGGAGFALGLALAFTPAPELPKEDHPPAPPATNGAVDVRGKINRHPPPGTPVDAQGRPT